MRVVIAGGGIIGLALARRLLAEGAAVAIIDSGAPSATAAAAGMLAPSFEHAPDHAHPALADFARASLHRWRGYAPELESDAGAFIDHRRDGILEPAFDEGALARQALSLELLLEAASPAALLTAAEARALAPGLAGDLRGGLFAPEDGQVDPRRVLTALIRDIERRGGAFFRGRAQAIVEAGGAARGATLDDGAVVEGDAVVLAAGAAVARIIGAGAVPVFPVKGEAVALATPGPVFAPVIRAPGAYLCPKADGRLVIGATESRGDESLDPSARAIAMLKENAARAFPACAAFAETERWAGLRPATPDGAPILGRDPRGPKALYCALGHYRNGVLLAPESAEILARLILKGESSPFLDAFRPDRFPI